MRFWSDSLLHLGAPIVGVALLCAAASATADTKLRSSLQPEVTSEQATVGFRVRSQPLPALQPITLDVVKFAFTAPGKTAAGAISPREQTVERNFSFTPSRSVKGLTVGVTTRAAVPATDRLAIASATESGRPVSSSVDVALNYNGFQLRSGAARNDTGVGGLSGESFNVGLGYAKGRIRTDITATADNNERMFFGQPGRVEPRYGVEANGLFSLSPSVSVGGTVRYRLAPAIPTPLDPNRDDQAVILGGALSF